MARVEINEFYHQHRFVIFIPSTQDSLGVSECYQDPFTGSLVIGRGMEVGGPTLAERLAGTSELTVYLLGRGTCRPIDVSYNISTAVSRVLNLDAMNSGVAMDWIELPNPMVVVKGEIQLGDLPLPMRRLDYVTSFSRNSA